MSELIDTTEMYLKTVYELEEDGVPPLRARIVDRLDHSGPTVSQTVARMERDGLMMVADDRSLELTDEGRRRATEVIRKHRLAERLLLDVVGLDRRMVHEEACRWEHVMSEQVENRLVEILGDVTTDPFGNPIPALDAVHPHPAPGEVSLERQARAGSGEGTVVRVGEPIQALAPLLEAFEDAGIVPGAAVTFSWDRGEIAISGPQGDPFIVPDDMARHLFLAI